MKNISFLFTIIFITVLIFLYSCETYNGFVDIPNPPDPVDSIIPVDTVPLPGQTTVSCPFSLSATVAQLLTWNLTDSVFVSTIIDDKNIERTLHVDSISEDGKTAWFVDTLSAEPKDDTKWIVSRPACCEDLSIQSGSFDDLNKYIELTGFGNGKTPSVHMNHNINVLHVKLPGDVTSIETLGGFKSQIPLPEVSSANDFVYLAIPVTCETPIIITAKNEDGLVFRSKQLSIDEICVGIKEDIVSVSLLDRPRITVEIKTPYSQYLKGNFSGITYLGEKKYAVVDDDRLSVGEGWFPFVITLDDDCQVESISKGNYVTSYLPNRDLEGIAYNPSSETMWLVGEQDNLITEHSLNGERTGNILETSMFEGTTTNNGIESLTYNDITKRLWTTTEAGLEKDGGNASPVRSKQRANMLRFQSYDENGTVCGQWIYITDEHTKKTIGNLYSFGVPCLCALDDGRLLVMEREAKFEYVIEGEVAFCHEKLYLVDPTSIPEGGTLEKTLLLEIPSSVVASESSETITGEFANYEGMCLGPWRPDGNRVLMLVSDSQGNMSITYSLESTPFVLPDVFLPIILKMSDE